MRVLTDTAGLREERRQILGLHPAAHPSSCLLCEEQDDCRRTQQTIRKAGVATGCRSCPRDGTCELQHVAELVGVDRMRVIRSRTAGSSPSTTSRSSTATTISASCAAAACACARGARRRRARTFIDPDQTLIGPAFGTLTHVDGRLRVLRRLRSVCPTGALADKVSKWDGSTRRRRDARPARLCPLGCQARAGATRPGAGCLQVHGARDAAAQRRTAVPARAVLPARDRRSIRIERAPAACCASGRVPDRERRTGTSPSPRSSARARRLRAPRDVPRARARPISPTRAVFAAQRLAREAVLSDVRSTRPPAPTLPGGPDVWSRLFALPVSLEDVATCDVAVVAGLDARYSFSVAGVQIRRAVRRGARLVVVDARESSLARAADQSCSREPGAEAAALTRLLRKARR